MIPLLLILRWLIVITLVLLPCLVIHLMVRRWKLSRGRGAFDCYLRLAIPQRSWRMGIGRYRRHVLAWFPLFGLTFKPAYLIQRRHLQVSTPRWPTASEQSQLYDGQKIVRVQPENSPMDYELGLAQAALNGLMAWIEAAPPGEGQYGKTHAPGGGSAPETTGRVPKIEF